jgi:hypothetical protein
MLQLRNLKGQGTPRASAVVRLCAAREALWRAQNRHATARETPAEPWTERRVGEAAAELATRQEWLHWMDHGTSIQPQADGEWARPLANQDSGDGREVKAGAAGPLRGPSLGRGARKPLLRSVR